VASKCTGQAQSSTFRAWQDHDLAAKSFPFRRLPLARMELSVSAALILALRAATRLSHAMTPQSAGAAVSPFPTTHASNSKEGIAVSTCSTETWR
jgi:hypothetical protein